MMNILKWLRKHMHPDCRHEWEQLELVSVYIDYSGFEKVLYRCKCKKFCILWTQLTI